MNYMEEFVEINGIEEYMLHFPGKEDGPVILFIHGGPGQAESLFAHYMEAGADGNYTVVHYDQRGTGKTYWKNRKMLPEVELLKADLLETVIYLKRKYKKEKIIILGHSWGSVLGSMFALEHPEHVLCYIGVGQVINLIENEREGLRIAAAAIEKSGNKKDKEKLEQLKGYPPAEYGKETMQQIGKLRKLQGKYKLAFDVSGSVIKIVLKSPIFKISDIPPLLSAFKVNEKLMEWLWSTDLKQYGVKYKTPVYYLLGDKDYQTPFKIAEKYLKEIEAPDKALYLVENAGHVPMLDNRIVYRQLLNKILLPYEKV